MERTLQQLAADPSVRLLALGLSASVEGLPMSFDAYHQNGLVQLASRRRCRVARHDQRRKGLHPLRASGE